MSHYYEILCLLDSMNLGEIKRLKAVAGASIEITVIFRLTISATNKY